MPKRKGIDDESSTKKARTELSRYTLLSYRSKNSILTEKEETEQQTIESDLLAETNLLLDHLTDDNVQGLEKHLKAVLKKDKSKKTKHNRFSASVQYCVFKFILENSSELSDNLNTKLKNCFNLVKVASISDVKKCEYLELFANHTIKTNQIHTIVRPIVASIAHSLDKSELSSNIFEIIFKILSDCNLNEGILIDLLVIMESMNASNQNAIKAVELLINTVFEATEVDDESTDEFITIIKPPKKITWTVKYIEELVEHSFGILSQYDILFMRSFVYEKIIENLITSKRTLMEKVAYKKAEKFVLDKFMNEMSKESKKKPLASADFLKAFKIILHKYTLNASLNRFFISLYLSANLSIDSTLIDELNNEFIVALHDMFDLCLREKEFTWLENCTPYNEIDEEIFNLFKYRILINVLKPNLIVESLQVLSNAILDSKYVETECNENIVKPTSVSEYLILFVSKVLSELIENQKAPGTLLINELLVKCYESSKPNIYLNLLTLILNNNHICQLFYEETAEVIKLKKNIISRVTTSKKSNKSDIDVPLLDVMKSFVFTFKQEKLNELINHFVPQLNETYEAYRKYCVNGLLSLLKSLNTLPLDNTHRYRSLFERKRTNENQKLSESIIEHLKKILNKTEKKIATKPDCATGFHTDELKTTIYESLCKVLKLNSKLVIPIVKFFLEQIKKILIKSQSNNEAYFDLGKCIAGTSLRLVEPADVLFHCADLCTTKSIKYISDNNENIESPQNVPVAELKKILNLIANTYLNRDTKSMFEIYKNQTINQVIKQSSPAKSMIILHQLELGLIDGLMEHVINNQRFTEIVKVLAHNELATSLISTEIEELMSLSDSKSNVKRKLTPEPTTSAKSNKLKKFKFIPAISENDKENEMPKSSSQYSIREGTKTKREPLANLTNRPLPLVERAMAETPTVVQFSLTNIQFDYVPRITNSCCVKMIQICQCSSERGFLNDLKLFKNESVRAALIRLIINPKFFDYVIKIIEKKLKMLLMNCEDQSQVYDPETIQKSEVFEFLSDLWENMCQRINGTIDDKGNSVFNEKLRQNFNQSFLIKTHKFLIFCQNILTLINKNYQKLLPKLVANERKAYVNEESWDFFGELQNNKAKTKFVWGFLLNCANTVRLHLTPTASNQIYANKCCTAMLTLMYELAKTTRLTSVQYDNFFNWLCELCEQQIAGQGDLNKAIIKLMVYLANKRSSAAVTLKYLIVDFYNHMSDQLVDEDDTQLAEETEFLTETKQYQLINQKNPLEYQQIVLEQLQGLIAELHWTLDANVGLEQSKLLGLLCKQLDSIILFCSYAFKSIFDIKSVDLVLRLMIKFYDFLKQLFQSRLVENLDEDNKDLIKTLIDLLAFSMQSNMSAELNRIQVLIINYEQQQEEKANNNDIINILKHKQLIPSLISAISMFEEQLIKFNTLHKDDDLMENYKIFIKSLQLNTESRVTRTISETQLNNIINYNQSISQ